MHRIRIWDLPTRLFHWLLAIAITAAFITGQIGGNLIDCHGRIGVAITGLLAFRLAWGLCGSSTARFASFVRGPSAIQGYLRGEWRGVGHNPLGALSVLGLLTLVAAQAGTGLFANDDIAFQGPLAALVSEAWSNRLSGIHETLIGVLIALVVVHVAAIAFYVRVKKENLLQPMLTGWKDVPAELAQGEARGGGLPALLIALLCAGLTVYGTAGLWLPAAPPTPPAAGNSSAAW